MSSPASPDLPRPGAFCRQLLAALDVSEGRRGRRKRDTTPDAIGLGIKRQLLEDAARSDPAPERFEAWLVERCRDAGAGDGGVHAMAREVFEEWRLATSSPSLVDWLVRGAPSDDA